ESCDGIDNDCDGCIDGTRPMPGAACVSLTRECGGAIGICTPGTETCVDGEWVGCTGVTPRPEECNNLDDDCDGIVDGFSEDCGMSDVGVCQFGVRLCTAGVLGECIGEIGPSEEICDGLDNDCDGEVDEGNPGGGAECGGGMGACSIGTLVCLDGALVCMGGVSPEPEVCDGDDNDCNGIIDDGIASAGPCGTDEGACMVGMLECIGGTFACIGATEPAPEICNCVDDDCDGEIDEEAAGESLCPTGRCVACQCAQPCAEDEFPCSVGRRCVDNNNEECSPPRAADCVCVGDPCATVDCPDTNDDGDRIVCQAGVCVPICDTVSCGGTQVCRNTDGRCVDNSCRFLPCDTGRYCDESTGMCQADLCAAGGVMCTGGDVCNPATGMCTADDLCADVMCAPDHFCRNGDCFPGGTDAGPPPPPRDMGTGGRTDGGGGNPSGQERGLASGGGGLICAAPGALGSGDGSLAGLAALLLLGLALVTRRIRGKSPSPPRGEGRGEGVAR
ncbi:MAG: hypothetical protein IT379_03935, partial [Deltaproteobacteria bacterium]|nr:hypothetical protein [Deltaproteobacteria bacterium]